MTDLQATNAYSVQQGISIDFIINYLRHDVDTSSEVIDSFLENVRSNGDGDDRSLWIALLFRQGIIYPPSVDGYIQ